MEKIKGIGIWRNKDAIGFPDIVTFTDDSWDKELRKKVIECLENIGAFIVAGCLGKCILNCKMGRVSIGYSTDGKFCWPLDFVHFIKDHGLRPPEAFVKHILDNENNLQSFKVKDIESFFNNIDYEWWKDQKGWSDGSNIFREKIGKVILNPISVRLTQDIISFLRKYKGLKPISTMELYRIIKNGEKLLLHDYGYYSDYISELQIANKLGLNIQFEEVD